MNEVQIRDSSTTVQNIEKGLASQIKRLGSLLDGHMKPERFCALCVNAARTNPALLEAFEAAPASLWASIQTCAQLALEPNGPGKQAYLIPRWNKRIKAKEATLQIGFHGLIDLARRNPNFKRIVARCITLEEYEAGLFDFHEEPASIRHDWKLGIKRTVDLVNTGGEGYKDQKWEPTNLAGAYALVEMEDGAMFVRFLDAGQIAKRRASSSAPNGNFWRDFFESMARKTALRALLESGEVPLNADLQAAVSFDQKVNSDEETVEAAEEVRIVSVPDEQPEAPQVTGAQGFGDEQEIPIDPPAKTEEKPAEQGKPLPSWPEEENLY